MTVQNTICGKVKLGPSDIAHVTAWRFNISGNVVTYTSSSSEGHQLTLKGHNSGELSFDVLFDKDDSIYARMKPGDQITLLAFFDATRDWTIPARVNDMDAEVNVADGSPPTVSVTAMSHGKWTYVDGTESTNPCA
jgi:hypothetical protein